MGALFIIIWSGHYVYAGVSAQVFRAGNFLLGKNSIQRKKDAFFETAEEFPPTSLSNVWEPGEIPGRLRHCNGYELPMPPSKSLGRRE
jgi:hypothetical protein